MQSCQSFATQFRRTAHHELKTEQHAYLENAPLTNGLQRRATDHAVTNADGSEVALSVFAVCSLSRQYPLQTVSGTAKASTKIRDPVVVKAQQQSHWLGKQEHTTNLFRDHGFGMW